jgi:hypothetical protein
MKEMKLYDIIIHLPISSINPLISLTTFFWHILFIAEYGLGVLEFENFDSKPRYACFSIFFYLKDVSFFLE